MSTSLAEKWNKSLTMIRSNVGEERFRLWFSVAEPISYDNGEMVLKLPTSFYVDRYEDQFYDLFRAALYHGFGEPVKVVYEYNIVNNDSSSCIKQQSPERSHTINNKVSRQIESAPISEQKRDFDHQLSSSLNFENYCVGKSNQLAYTIAEHIANNPEKPEFNPYFLYGSVGVGKTHLIQAIGIRIKEKHPNARVLFNTMRQFQNLYQVAALEGRIPEFINWYQSMDCLLFDDLQEMTGPKTAQALFPIFNHLHAHNKKLIFTCDRPPMELDGIADRLIDRFKWGITEPLPAPDLELRKKILRAKASRGGLDLSAEIIDLIAESVTGSVRELEGVVMGLLTRCIKANMPLSVEIAREVISHTVKTPVRKSINFDMIVENTAEYFGLNPDAIFAKSRIRDIADARQMIMYLCSKHTGLSTPAIGAKLNREHSTVLHGIGAVKDRLATNRDTVKALEAIEAQLLK